MRLIAFTLGVLFLAAQATAGSIGVYANPDGTGCSVDIPGGTTATLYAVAQTFPGEPDGGYVAAGEFRVVGLPNAWVANATANPGIDVALGNPCGDGARFAFFSLQAGLMPLFAIEVHATSDVGNIRLDVVQHRNPQPPFGGTVDCPWLRYCDIPCDTGASCADGVSFFINSDGCSLGVEERSWSDVRELYR